MRQREPKMLLNLTRESVVCERVAIADRAGSRMRGLLGRRTLPTGEGLLLAPAPSIHTAFMRFPIDVVFLDADLRVVKLVQKLAPWRTASARRAKSVLELPAGESSRRDLGLADRLVLVEPAPDHDGSEHPQPGGVLVSDRARVLLVAGDRRFRSVASALLTRRGYSVAIGDCTQDLAQLASREGAEVVVIDATGSLTAAAQVAARLWALRPPIGVVAVSAEPRHPLATLPVISKWGSFDELFAAIEQARVDTGRSGATHESH
jgi:uncharacterized membrane protein (UPF0127 family)